MPIPWLFILSFPKEVEEIQKAIEEAFQVLMDETSRRSYDQSHFQNRGQSASRKTF